MLTQPSSPRENAASVMRRLTALAPLSDQEQALIERAARNSRRVAARTEIVRETERPVRPCLLLQGWIGHQRILRDGRRQIVGFTLPGEVFGRHHISQGSAMLTQVALEPATYCFAPPANGAENLARAYARDQLAQRLHMVDNIVRLGRMDARERVIDMLLEIYERLSLSGEVAGTSFHIPLTQECFADVLGLTPVHLNRTLQSARRDGDLTWQGKRVVLHDPAALAARVGRALAGDRI